MKRLLLLLLAVTIAAVFLAGLRALVPGTENDYIYGTTILKSTLIPTQEMKDSYYYRDDWFFESPDEQNDSLALVSM